MEASGPTVAVVGSGNVATHLAMAIDKVANVAQVYSPNLSHAQALASRLKSCSPIDQPSRLMTDCDLCLIAISDDALPEIARKLPRISGIAAHTSGSVGMQAIEPLSSHYGVFYPLQTFSKDAKVDVSQVPFFTEASDGETLAWLDSMASQIGGSCRHADSQQRAALHIAAVFACNFTNHMWSIAQQLLAQNGYNFDVFKPLLQATLDKAMSMPPALAQTGPAKRQDTEIMHKHMQSLPDNWREIYSLISDSIIAESMALTNKSTY